MSTLHFADNTVLIHFALLDRLELLEGLLNGHGKWTSSVKVECLESSNFEGLSDLADVERFLGEALEPSSPEEYLATQDIREELRVPGDGPHKHLGEAETLAIIHMRSLDANMVTDDTGALRVARKLGIRTVTTSDLLLLAGRADRITAQDCWDSFTALQGRHGRFLPGAPSSFADVLFRCETS